MAEGLQSLTTMDWSKGLNAVASPFTVGKNQFLRSLNLLLDEHGAVRVRDGALTVDTAPDGVSLILSLYDLIQNDGSQIPLGITRDAAGVQRLTLREVQPWATLGTFATEYDTPSIYTFTNVALIAAGYETPKLYDGTTFRAITANTGGGQVIPPGAKHMAVHLGSLWLWNTAAATNSTDGPSCLRQSDVNNPDSWPLANQVFISKDDGQSGQGLGVYTVAETGISPLATLIAFKDYSGYQVSGVFGSANFTIQKTKSDMGCVSPRTIQFVSGFGLIRLSHRGFALYDGVNDTLLSEEVRPYIFGENDITGLDWAHIGLATATQVQNPPLYICYAATGASGSGLDRMFVYDLIRKAWTILTFPVACATVNLFLDPGQLPFVLQGESGGGRVQRIFGGDEFDDGALVPWSLRLPPAPAQRLLGRTYIRRILLKISQARVNQSILGRFALGPLKGAQNLGVFTKTSTVDSRSLPGSGLEQTVDADLYYDIGRTGELLYHEYSGSGHVVIRGAEVQVRSKPSSRPMRI